MTLGLLQLFAALIVLNAILAYTISSLRVVNGRINREARTLVSLVGVIGFMFVLFIGFNSSEISQRNASLRLASEREVSAIRSLLNIASGVGPTAAPIRDAALEYLQTVTTSERAWLEAGATGEAPGDASVYSLALVTTVFAEQARSTDVIKSLVLSRVDELINSRTERLTRLLRGTDIVLWIGLMMMAATTQLVAAFALAGSRLQAAVFFSGYTVVALVGLGYLAWADRLVGPSRISEQLVPFNSLLERTQSAATAPTQGGGTIERLRATGTITIGHRDDQFPFAHRDAEGRPIGYTLDLCRRIVSLIRDPSGKDSVRLRMVLLNPGNRVAMVANGSVDMECDLSTDTVGRDEQVAFLDPTYVGATKIIVRAAAGLSKVADLAGKRLLVVAGSSNVQIAMALNAGRNLSMMVIPVKGSAEATQMIDAGNGDAFLSSDVLLYGLIAKARPGTYRVLDEAISKRTYAIMVRRQDTAFRDAANKALRGMVKSGEFEEIYKRWFESPIEPGNVNLKLPMSDGLKERLKAVD